MPCSNLKFYKGFTLIELLVAIGIMAMVAAVAMPNLRQFSQSQEVDGAANQLINALRTAQSSARSNIKCPGGQASNNWNVVLTAGTYTLNANCTVSGTAANQQVLTSPYRSNTNSPITFRLSNNRCTAGQSLTITFINNQLSYDCAGTSQNIWPVNLTLSGSGQTKAVVVEVGGVIKIQ